MPVVTYRSTGLFPGFFVHFTVYLIDWSIWAHRERSMFLMRVYKISFYGFTIIYLFNQLLIYGHLDTCFSNFARHTNHLVMLTCSFWLRRCRAGPEFCIFDKLLGLPLVHWSPLSREDSDSLPYFALINNAAVGALYKVQFYLWDKCLEVEFPGQKMYVP